MDMTYTFWLTCLFFLFFLGMQDFSLMSQKENFFVARNFLLEKFVISRDVLKWFGHFVR
jgi:hypothetical protein